MFEDLAGEDNVRRFRLDGIGEFIQVVQVGRFGIGVDVQRGDEGRFRQSGHDGFGTIARADVEMGGQGLVQAID